MPVAIEICVQKTEADCAVSALTMLSGKPYRVVSEAAMSLAPLVHRRGLYLTQIRLLAALIKLPLVARSRPALVVKHATDLTGLVTVRNKQKLDHVVVVFEGVVIDPMNGLVWKDLDVYLTQGGWTVNGFLEEAA